MKPITIKLEGALPASLEWALRQEELAVAADRYAEFLRGSPNEAAWLDEWARSDLTTPPSTSDESVHESFHKSFHTPKR